MKNNGIFCFNKKDTILNNPGHFFFQITEENEYKYNNSQISRKNYDEVKNNIVNVFRKISENLKSQIHTFHVQNNSDLIKYHTDITNKLDKFVDMSTRSFRFPGLQVINLTSKQIDVFSQNKEKVLICEKSDGVRYLLIHFSNDKYLMLGRNLEFYQCNFTVKLPNNTHVNINNNLTSIQMDWEIVNLLDGELILDEVEDLEINNSSFRISNNNNKNETQNLNLTVEQKSSMVYINNKLHKIKFVVFDCIILNRKNIGHFKFKDRLYELSRFFNQMKLQRFIIESKEKFLTKYSQNLDIEFKEKINEKTHLDNIRNDDKTSKFKIDLFLKDYFTFDKIKILYENICGKLPHENDGIILNLDDYPYYSGQATEIFKWKPRSMNTVDFEIQIMNFHKRNAYNPKVNEKDNYEKLIILNVHEKKEKKCPVNILIFEKKEEEEKFINECLCIANTSNRIVVECYFEFDKKVLKENIQKFEILKRNEYNILQDLSNEERFNYSTNTHRSGYWKFMRFRKDKLNGNSVQTFFKVWESIEDDLTISKMQEKLDFYKQNQDLINDPSLTQNIPLSKMLNKTNLININQNTTPLDVVNNNAVDEVLLNKKRVVGNSNNEENDLKNYNLSANKSNIFKTSYNQEINNNNFQTELNLNEKENKKLKIKVKKEEKQHKDMNKLEIKKFNAKECLDLALNGIPKEKINQNENNKNNKIGKMEQQDEEDFELSDSPSE